MTFHTYTEIVEQASSWEATIRELGEHTAALKEHTAPTALFSGCGSPYYLARSAAAAYRTLTGKPATAAPASDIWLYPEATLSGMDNAVLFVISRSGETTEVLRAVKSFRGKIGGDVLGVTCYPESPLAPLLSPALIAQASQEVSLTQTRSFCNMLLMTLGFCYASADTPLSEAFHALPDHVNTLIQTVAPVTERIGSNLKFDQYFFLGGGAAYGIANEGMLKMKEMSLTVSEGYHFMEFRHGPMAMVNEGTVVVGLVSQGAAEHEIAVLRDMQELGATIIAVVPSEIAVDDLDVVIPLPEGLTDIERLPLYLPVMQLLGYYRTLARGLDPDNPTNLNAVVHLDNTDK